MLSKYEICKIFSIKVTLNLKCISISPKILIFFQNSWAICGTYKLFFGHFVKDVPLSGDCELSFDCKDLLNEF